jgi:iron complex transport system ATP-binding protein
MPRALNGSCPLRPVRSSLVREALDTVAELNMFFRLVDPVTDPDGWQPVSAVYAGADREPLASLITSVRSLLGGCELRVAGSMVFFGYASRLLAPQLGALVRRGRVPDVRPDLLVWRRSSSEMLQLGALPAAGWEGHREALLDHVLSTAVNEHLRPLEAALGAHVRLARGLLIGNIASAVVAALRFLDDEGGTECHSLASRALTSEHLHGSGELRGAAPVFVRRSCCLYYRIPSGGLCADCALGVPRRRTHNP